MNLERGIVMLQRVLQSKLLWNFVLMMRRRHFSFTDQGYIRLIGKKDADGDRPYLRLSYDSDHGWYYRDGCSIGINGMVGEASYQDVIGMVKFFIKHDKLRAIRCI